jgi:sensor c-di-GMP phosphodiesterase-like protein
MLRGIVALAAALRLHTVAEGVETWEEAFFLRAAGVDYGQGWFWSKAVPALEASRMLKAGFPTAPERRFGSKKL